MAKICYPLEVRIDIIADALINGDASNHDGDTLKTCAHEVHELKFEVEELERKLKKSNRSGNTWFGLTFFWMILFALASLQHWTR